MKLNERLKRVEKDEELQTPGPKAQIDTPPDPFAGLKERARSVLYAKLGARLNDPSLGEEELELLVNEELTRILEAETAPLSPGERRAMVAQIRDDIVGYGPVQMFLDDPSVTEIMVNSGQPIFVERSGRIERTLSRFASDDHIRRVIERIVSQVGRRIDESSPMVDARLPDGSRVNAIIPPLAVDGPVLTIRVFAKDPFTADDLIELHTLTPDLAALLEACARGRLNILISGGTGTGKTTLLNVVSAYIPEDQRIITIEDAVELQLAQEHVIRLESRPANSEGKGMVAIRDLVRNALRMRPDRIVVGEVRGGEALDMLQAMNTGHEGSLSTVHSNSPRDALSRLETMVMMAGVDLPARAIREQISSALHLIVHLTRLADGTRRITEVSEVVGMEGDTITLQDVFAFDYAAGLDEKGRFLGETVPTGIRPHFAQHLKDLGIELPAQIFGAPPVKLVNKGRGGRK
jgi:pilus assembly protein CpaF